MAAAEEEEGLWTLIVRERRDLGLEGLLFEVIIVTSGGDVEGTIVVVGCSAGIDEEEEGMEST